MGHRIGTRKRGKGSSAYTSPASPTKFVWSTYNGLSREGNAVITQIYLSAKNCPVMEIMDTENSNIFRFPCALGAFIGQRVFFDRESVMPRAINIMRINKIAPSVPFFFFGNRDPLYPRFVSSSGSYASYSKFDSEGNYNVVFPSKRIQEISGSMFAIIGRISGGERVLKPLMKAVTKRHKFSLKARRSSISTKYLQNVVDHPHGGGSSIGRPTSVSKSTPPGRKVGQLGKGRVKRFNSKK